MYTNYDPNQNYNPYAQEYSDGAAVPANSNSYAQGQDNNAKTLTSGSASGFHTGLGQSNEIGVVARGDKIAIYVNGQLVTSVTDNTYSSGQIGVAAYNLSSTDVVFSHAKVWVL